MLAPFVATGRAASGARDRLGARGAGAGVDTAEGGADAWPAGPAAETTADSVKVVTDETAEVPTAAHPDVETPTGDTDADVTTAPVAEVPAASSSVDAPTVDTRPPSTLWAGKSLRRPRFGFVAGLAAAVVVVCVVVAVLVATMSTSSNKGQPARRASPPASTAPAPPSPPFKLVSSDPQGAVYNVASGRVALSAVASGRVWLEVVAGTGPFGQVLWQGVLSQGQNQTITNDAPVWIRIGASSNVSVTVNGSGVLLPQAPNTYNLTFSHAPA